MLRINSHGDGSTASQDVWKVLVYDQFCRDLISPLMSVKDLRSEGVTLHMYVDELYTLYAAYSMKYANTSAQIRFYQGVSTLTTVRPLAKYLPYISCAPLRITSRGFAKYALFTL